MIDVQEHVRDALTLVDIHVPSDLSIVLDDAETGPSGVFYLIGYGQLEAALEQFRLTTGEDPVDIGVAESELGWL